MAWKKGQSGNPSGLDVRSRRLKRMLEDLSERAIGRLARLAESENEAIALGATKEILDRALGRPRQMVEANVSVQHASVAHLAALELLTRAGQGSTLDLTANANPLISKGYSGDPGKQAITIDADEGVDDGAEPAEKPGKQGS